MPNSRIDSAGSPRHSVAAVSLLGTAALGLGYFLLINATQSYLVRVGMPQVLLDVWIEHPRAGALLVSAFQALASYWLTAASVGLALALIMRRDFIFFGAVATGAALVMAAQTRLDGWFTLVEIGPQFWFAHKLNMLSHDPFGMLSAVIALPICTWVWGRLLS